MTFKTLRRLFLLSLCIAPLVLCAVDAYARPGGGHSYSGGGGGYSGGGGGYSGGGYSDDSGGGGELLYLLFWLLFEVPVIGVPLTILVVGGFIWSKSRDLSPNVEWNSAPYIAPPPPEITMIRRLDPEFSSVLFEDFLYHLYAEAHQARENSDRLEALTPQFSKKARLLLAQRTPPGAHVERVVIGSMRVSSLTLPEKATTDDGKPYYVKLAVRFESNMTCVTGEQTQNYYVDETWMLARAANAVSVPPDRMRATLCANCGAPFAHSKERICSSCDVVVDDGRFGWVVTNILLSRQETRPTSLTGYAPEVGTHDMTHVHPKTRQELHALWVDDPSFTSENLIERAHLIFEELYQAWNDDDLARARPYVSDGLFDYLRYWLDAYREEGLENLVEDHKLTNYKVANVVRDLHYDAITIRIWATGKDYTVDSKGRIVGGSNRKYRNFSEYWTLIRSATSRGPALVEKQCPHCGAEQRISMAGICEFCEAHVTSGKFGWVLSKIEQDESYLG